MNKTIEWTMSTRNHIHSWTYDICIKIDNIIFRCSYNSYERDANHYPDNHRYVTLGTWNDDNGHAGQSIMSFSDNNIQGIYGIKVDDDIKADEHSSLRLRHDMTEKLVKLHPEILEIESVSRYDIIEAYQKEVHRTSDDMYADKSNMCFNFMRMCSGLSTEANECLDIIKKAIDYNNGQISPEDKTNMIKELGDVLFYLVNISNAFDVDLKRIIDENIKKSYRRYPHGFTFKDSKIHTD